MFKKFRELINSPTKLDKINSQLEQIQTQLVQLTNIRKSNKYREVLVDGVKDFYELKYVFEDKLRKEIKEKYDCIADNLNECVIQYDKILYYNRDSINYIDLTYKIMELEILRDIILSRLFPSKFLPDNGIESFYLYMINNFYLNETVKTIPAIDLSKVFLINSDSEIDAEKYVLVDIKRDKISVLSSEEYFEFESRYRKTVVRVMYSIYRERYYLYHLQNRKEEKPNNETVFRYS